MNIFLDNIIFSLQKAGGISVVWYELLKRAISDEELKISILEEENQNIFRQLLDIPSETQSNNSLFKLPLKIQRYLDPKVKKENVIFHSSYYRIGRGEHIKNVTTVHDFTYEYYRNGIAKTLHSLQKARAIKGADKIICVSENTKKDLLKFYPQVNPKKIAVIYNGVSDIFHPIVKDLDSQLKKLTSFKRNEFALFVGDRKSSYKNFHIAVDACSLTKKKLIIVGGGMLTKSENIELTKKLGINRFQQLNGLSIETLNILYNGALCFIYPSSYEGFGIPIIEAQKAGCPVIAINTSSIPEVIGDVATLLPCLDITNVAANVEKLGKDQTYRYTQKEIGLSNAKRFSWDFCYNQTKKIYHELLD